nr:MAG TPA: hypothetical protein [Crassvirales sp.]
MSILFKDDGIVSSLWRHRACLVQGRLILQRYCYRSDRKSLYEF